MFFFAPFTSNIICGMRAQYIPFPSYKKRSSCPCGTLLLGTLSKDVFERRTSTGSEAFSLFICLDANKLVLLSFFSLLKTIYPRVSTKPLPNDAKSLLPVDVCRSKTLLLKLPIVSSPWVCQFPKIRFSKPSKAVKVKTNQRGVAVFVPFKQGSMCLVIVMSSQ